MKIDNSKQVAANLAKAPLANSSVFTASAENQRSAFSV